MIEAIDVLRIAVAHGLPGGELPAATAGELPIVSDDVIALAARHRVQGLLWLAIQDGAVEADEQHLVNVGEAFTGALRTCLVAERTAVHALEAMGSAGVDARVLKGVAIAHLDHPDPAHRVFGDADILIRRSDYRRALAALTAAGFERSEPPVRRWWEQRFGKAIVLRSPESAELDLHLSITGGYFGARIDHDELWARAGERFHLADLEACGLDVDGRLLHACCHAVLGGGSGLRALRDVAQLILVSGADWRAVVQRAERDGVELVLAAAVRATWTELGLDHRHEIVQWAAGYRPDPVQERAFAGYTAAFAEGWAPEGHSVLAALGPLDRARFLVGLAFPSRASMRARHRTWRQHVRQGVQGVRSRR